jgi:ATP-dependent exoDNAse (exonuclease V) beta subunit
LASDARSELARVASEIRERRDRGVAFADQAVLCRTNSQVRHTVEALKDAGIPTQGPVNLRESQEIKDALAVLSLLCETDGAGLARVVDFPENGLTREDLIALLDWARREKVSPRTALERCTEIEGLSPEAVTYIQELNRLLGDLRRWGGAWYVLLGYLFHSESRVRDLLDDDSQRGRERRAQFGQLAALASVFGEREDLVETNGIAGFLEYVRDMLSFEMGNIALPVAPGGDSVIVMTAHKSKGLEFPVVYLPHLAEGKEGRWPFSPPKDEVSLPTSLVRDAEAYDDDEAEERRLFYVAATRAEDELVMSRAETYRKDGRSAKPSRFVEDLIRAAEGRDLIRERMWDTETRAPSEGSSVARSTDEPSEEAYPLSRLRTYEICPQQYEYAHVYELVEETSAYQRFHRCVYRVLAWMEVEAQEKNTNPTLREALEQLGEIWEREGPVGHWYERTYRRRAEAIVGHWQASERALAWRVQVQLPVATPGGMVKVRADGVTQERTGTLVIAQHRFDRPRKSHAKDLSDQLALYKAYGEAEGRSVRVLIHYLCSNEEVEVAPGGRMVSNRVKKAARLIEGIRQADYPANSGQACAKCSWNLICPA